jgi:hypothetical protein
VSSLPPDFFVVCGSDLNVVAFVGVEDRGAEGISIGNLGWQLLCVGY